MQVGQVNDVLHVLRHYKTLILRRFCAPPHTSTTYGQTYFLYLLVKVHAFGAVSPGGTGFLFKLFCVNTGKYLSRLKHLQPLLAHLAMRPVAVVASCPPQDLQTTTATPQSPTPPPPSSPSVEYMDRGESTAATTTTTQPLPLLRFARNPTDQDRSVWNLALTQPPPRTPAATATVSSYQRPHVSITPPPVAAHSSGPISSTPAASSSPATATATSQQQQQQQRRPAPAVPRTTPVKQVAAHSLSSKTPRGKPSLLSYDSNDNDEDISSSTNSVSKKQKKKEEELCTRH